MELQGLAHIGIIPIRIERDGESRGWWGIIGCVLADSVFWRDIARRVAGGV